MFNSALLLNRLRPYTGDLDAIAMQAVVRQAGVQVIEEVSPTALQDMAVLRSITDDGVLVADGRVIRAYATTPASDPLGARLFDAERVFPDPDLVRTGTRPGFYVQGGKAYMIIPSELPQTVARKVLVCPYPNLYDDEVSVSPLFAEAALHKAGVLALRQRLAALPERLISPTDQTEPPTPPVAPDISYSPQLAELMGAVSVGSFTPAPALAAPAFTGSTTPPTDAALAAEGDLPGALSVDGESVPTQSSSGPIDGDTDAPTIPTIDHPLDGSRVERFLQEYDPEMVAAAIQRLNEQIAEERLVIERALATLQSFRADLDADRVTIEQFQSELARHAATIQERRLAIEVHMANVQRHRTAVETAIAAWQAENIVGRRGSWESQFDRKLALFGQNLQTASAVWTADVEAHRTAVQVAVADAQMAQQRAQTNAQLLTDQRQRNEMQRIDTAFKRYEQQLTQYSQQLAQYGQIEEARLRRAGFETERATNEARMLAFDFQRASQAYAEARALFEHAAFTVAPRLDPVPYSSRF